MNPELPTRQVALAGVPLLTVLGDDGPGEQPAPKGELVISRFAWVRRDGDRPVLETSLGPQSAVLEDPRAVALLFAFATPRKLDPALAGQAGLPLDTAAEIISVLHEASLVLDSDQARAEDAPPLAVWEFHDLLFHARSRPGRSRLTHGGTYRFLDRLAPTPALPDERWPDAIGLATPDYEQLEREDPPLTAVQQARSSIRGYGRRPLTVTELGEFLYRVGRVEDYWENPLPGPPDSSLSFVAKPYPSGGAAYELELYTAVRACEGLEPGLYHYAAAAHRLSRVSGSGPELDRLFVGSGAAMGVAAQSLQVVTVITARFARVAWKYESLAYELVLKHVGVVLQTMYLAAAAMGLAPCALGTGDSDLFARASGIDYYEEPAVGELALGSRPPSSPSDP